MSTQVKSISQSKSAKTDDAEDAEAKTDDAEDADDAEAKTDDAVNSYLKNSDKENTKIIVAKQNIIANKNNVITTLLNIILNDLKQKQSQPDKIKAISDILEKVEKEKTIVSLDVQELLGTNKKVEKEKEKKALLDDVEKLLNKIRHDLEQKQYQPEIHDKIKAIIEKVEKEKTMENVQELLSTIKQVEKKVPLDVQELLSTIEKLEKKVPLDVEKLLSTIENLNRLENFVGFIVSKLYQHYNTKKPGITLEEFEKLMDLFFFKWEQPESDINAILNAFNDYDFIKLKNELEQFKKPKWYPRIFRKSPKKLNPTPNLPIKVEVNRLFSVDTKTIVAKQNIIANKNYVITTLLTKIRDDLEQSQPDKIKAITDILKKVENEITLMTQDVLKLFSINEKVKKEKTIVSPNVEKLLSTTIENLNRLENSVGFIVSKLYQHYNTNNPDINLEAFEEKIFKLKWETDKNILDAFNDYDFVEFNKLPLMSGQHREELEQNTPRAKPKVTETKEIEPIEIEPEADAETIEIEPEAKGIKSRVADQTRKIKNFFNTSKEVAEERVAYQTRKIKNFFNTPEEAEEAKKAEADAAEDAAEDRKKTKNIITKLLDLITTATEEVTAEKRAIAKIKAADEKVFIPYVIPGNEFASILRIKNILELQELQELQDYNLLFVKLYNYFRIKYNKPSNKFEKIIETSNILYLNGIGKLYNNPEYNKPDFETLISTSSKISDEKKITLINIFYLLNTFYDYKFTELEDELIKPPPLNKFRQFTRRVSQNPFNWIKTRKNLKQPPPSTTEAAKYETIYNANQLRAAEKNKHIPTENWLNTHKFSNTEPEELTEITQKEKAEVREKAEAEERATAIAEAEARAKADRQIHKESKTEEDKKAEEEEAARAKKDRLAEANIMLQEFSPATPISNAAEKSMWFTLKNLFKPSTKELKEETKEEAKEEAKEAVESQIWNPIVSNPEEARAKAETEEAREKARAEALKEAQVEAEATETNNQTEELKEVDNPPTTINQTIFDDIYKIKTVVNPPPPTPPPLQAPTTPTTQNPFNWIKTRKNLKQPTLSTEAAKYKAIYNANQLRAAENTKHIPKKTWLNTPEFPNTEPEELTEITQKEKAKVTAEAEAEAKAKTIAELKIKAANEAKMRKESKTEEEKKAEEEEAARAKKYADEDAAAIIKTLKATAEAAAKAAAKAKTKKRIAKANAASKAATAKTETEANKITELLKAAEEEAARATAGPIVALVPPPLVSESSLSDTIKKEKEKERILKFREEVKQQESAKKTEKDRAQESQLHTEFITSKQLENAEAIKEAIKKKNKKKEKNNWFKTSADALTSIISRNKPAEAAEAEAAEAEAAEAESLEAARESKEENDKNADNLLPSTLIPPPRLFRGGKSRLRVIKGKKLPQNLEISERYTPITRQNRKSTRRRKFIMHRNN